MTLGSDEQPCGVNDDARLVRQCGTSPARMRLKVEVPGRDALSMFESASKSGQEETVRENGENNEKRNRNVKPSID